MMVAVHFVKNDGYPPLTVIEYTVYNQYFAMSVCKKSIANTNSQLPIQSQDSIY